VKLCSGEKIPILITKLAMRNVVFWDVTRCSLVNVHVCFKGTQYLHLQGCRVSLPTAFFFMVTCFGYLRLTQSASEATHWIQFQSCWFELLRGLSRQGTLSVICCWILCDINAVIRHMICVPYLFCNYAMWLLMNVIQLDSSFIWEQVGHSSYYIHDCWFV
jgi:hypothetical protein